jgi:hypothetical protein
MMTNLHFQIVKVILFRDKWNAILIDGISTGLNHQSNGMNGFEFRTSGRSPTGIVLLEKIIHGAQSHNGLDPIQDCS